MSHTNGRRLPGGRRLAAAAFVAALALATGPALAASASAAPRTTSASTHRHASADESPIDALMRAAEVRYADAHWNWTAWNDSTPVAGGADQPNYQCAEFVARSLAAAGLIPGLSPDAPQNDYFTYHAPNGEVYDLLLISDLPQYHNLYDYLHDSGIGVDLGDHPELAKPGDVVVTYAGPDGTKSHTGLVATAATATSEPLVDGHNHARLDYGYHYFAPSHLVQLVPNALAEVWTWTIEQEALHGPFPPVQTPPTTNAPLAPRALVTDPAGPQV
ncbi:amidase domain-containing protein [Streptacidiphilus anmyonensis]|uniref:amidase domain-containing protein n=1 Tax=Streptacidiphilus anmyonensis TaxID=405782 RepID=UPI0005A99799|nr:amidase domain-containing protein [Streptacidiphilus anmyonensis]